MSVSGGGNLYPNWLGSASLTIPNNQAVINGNIVNLVPTVGTSSNKYTWADGNFYTYYTASNVAAGTYLVGWENFTDPLTTSNAGNGWAAGDYFLAQVKDKDGLATRSPQNFIRPYTGGIQSNATTPYNKGSTDNTCTGIVVVTSNTDLVWQAYLGKDVTTSYPQTRLLTIESPWFQKIA